MGYTRRIKVNSQTRIQFPHMFLTTETPTTPHQVDQTRPEGIARLLQLSTQTQTRETKIARHDQGQGPGEMSRLIDRLPKPAFVREKKVIVTSRSRSVIRSCLLNPRKSFTKPRYRSGTFSLYQALQMLGYRPYHMYEVVQSITHMGIFEEALNAKYFGVGKPYGKAEFDKWFANYDVGLSSLSKPEDTLADACFRHLWRFQRSLLKTSLRPTRMQPTFTSIATSKSGQRRFQVSWARWSRFSTHHT